MLQSIRDGDSVIVRLAGELDHYCAQSVRRELDGLIADRTIRWLILDFSRLQFMDSSGIAVVINALRAMARIEGKLMLSQLADQPRKVFRASGIDKLVDIKEVLT